MKQAFANVFITHAYCLTIENANLTTSVNIHFYYQHDYDCKDEQCHRPESLTQFEMIFCLKVNFISLLACIDVGL